MIRVSLLMALILVSLSISAQDPFVLNESCLNDTCIKPKNELRGVFWLSHSALGGNGYSILKNGKCEVFSSDCIMHNVWKGYRWTIKENKIEIKDDLGIAILFDLISYRSKLFLVETERVNEFKRDAESITQEYEKFGQIRIGDHFITKSEMIITSLSAKYYCKD